MLPKIPEILLWSKVGKPLKEVDPNIIVTWGKFKPAALAWMKAFRLELESHQNWAFHLEKSYLGHELLTHNWSLMHKISVYGPKITVDDYSTTVLTEGGKIKVIAHNELGDPLACAMSDVITPTAIYMTWPDGVGKFKMFIHKASRIARIKYKQPLIKTFINRKVLKTGATKWQVLEEYIQACTLAGVDPQRKDICDLVRNVSELESERAQNLEYNKVLGAE